MALAALAGCSRPYLVEEFKKEYQSRARVVAVAPLSNNTTVEEAPKLIWDAIYSELRGWQDDFTVTIQEEQDTRRRLADVGLTDAQAAAEPTARLCSILGTDAILRGTVTSFMTYASEDQMRQAIQLGVATGSQLNVDLAIRSCTDTALVWAWKVKKQGGFHSSPDELREQVGSEVAKWFPYRP
jgi:hypothetical protein